MTQDSSLTPAARLLAFCRAVQAPDLETYLELPPHATLREGLAALERKRRKLEANIEDPNQARAAQLLVEHYDLLKGALARRAPSPAPTPRSVPHARHQTDHYAALGVDPHAGFVAIEAAYRAQERRASGPTPAAKEAWATLGNPARRALYDANRRQRDRKASESLPPFDPETASIPFHEIMPSDLQSSGVRLKLVGSKDTREVWVSETGQLDLSITGVVFGSSPWRGVVESDHPALMIAGPRELTLRPGRHHFSLRIDAGSLQRQTQPCSVSFSNRDQEQILRFRLKAAPKDTRTAFLPHLLRAGLAILLVVAGWTIGTRTTVTPTGVATAFQTHALTEVPEAITCLDSYDTRDLEHIDVYTDASGSPTGFNFGGEAAPDVFSCIKEALLSHQYEASPDQEVTKHRFIVSHGDP